MNISHSTREFLQHILEEIEFLIDESRNISFEEFIKNPILTRAFIRSLEIIGEAVKKIPSDVKTEYDEIEWKLIAGMRDKLIHDYFGVDYELVWDVVKNKIPTLQKRISQVAKKVK